MKLPTFITLLYILFFHVSNPLICQTAWADAITIQQQSCGIGCVNFTSDIPKVIGLGGEVYRNFRYFWIFGDGSYKTGIFSIPSNMDIGTLTESHIYSSIPQGGNAYLELAVIYNDTDDPKRILINPANINSSIQAIPIYLPIPPSENLSIINALWPRAGDTMTYVVSFDNTCPEIIKKPFLGLKFDPSVMGVKRIFGKDMTSTNNFIYPTINGNGFFRVNYEDIPPTKRVNCFIQVYFKPNLVYNQPVKIEAYFSDNPDFPDTVTCSSDRKTVILSSVKEHDPNYIFADSASLCLSSRPDSIEYTINFQNIGNGAAANVFIYNVLPKCFDVESIRVIEPKGIQNSVENFYVNKETREIKWVLNNKFLNINDSRHRGLLNGTGQKGYGKDFMDTTTIDVVRYKVKFDAAQLPPPCGAIVNQAKIVFGINDPIWTNTFSTQIRCDDCQPCTFPSQQPIFLGQVEVSNFSSADLQLPISTGIRHWYPALNLDNIGSFNPAASPSEPIIYTASVTNGCEFRQYQFEVLVADSGGIWGYLLGGTFFILALIFGIFRKKKRNAEPN